VVKDPEEFEVRNAPEPKKEEAPAEEEAAEEVPEGEEDMEWETYESKIKRTFCFKQSTING